MSLLWLGWSCVTLESGSVPTHRLCGDLTHLGAAVHGVCAAGVCLHAMLWQEGFRDGAGQGFAQEFRALHLQKA